MDFFTAFHYDEKEFLEDVHWTSVYLLQKCTHDKELSEKIYALISDELNQEIINYQNTITRKINDSEIATLLGIVIYNRIFSCSDGYTAAST